MLTATNKDEDLEACHNPGSDIDGPLWSVLC